MFILSNVQSGLLDILLAILALLMAMCVAIPAHEFAHAFAAKCEGDYTAVVCKRYTLAPHAHFDLKGFFFLFLFGFGWAKPVPVDSRNFKHGRKSQFRVSIAGICANLLLAVVFLFLYVLIYKINPNFYFSGVYGTLVYQFLNASVSINFMLAFFNILPLYPLDGYKMIDSFSRYENKFLEFVKSYSIIIYFILIFTGIYSLYYTYTAGALMNFLIDLFKKLLRV